MSIVVGADDAGSFFTNVPGGDVGGAPVLACYREAVNPARLVLATAMIALVVCHAGCSSTEVSVKSTDSTETDPPFPPATCEPGTMPAIAGATCAPVGPTACADGFEKDETGWGCRAVAPETTCAPPLRAKLGSRECVPVDDCTAPFPPPGATLVTQAGAATLEATLEAAPRGATIAIDSGTYTLSYVPVRDLKIVGRCASKVKLVAPKLSVFTVGDGVHLDVTSVSMSSPTNTAFYVIQNGHATLTKVIITDSPMGVTSSRNSTLTVTSSMIVGDAKFPIDSSSAGGVIHGAELTFVDSDLHGYAAALAVFHAKSKLSVQRSIVTYDGTPNQAVLALALNGGALDVKESLFRAPRNGVLDVNDAPSTDSSVTATDKGAKATFTSSEISQVGAAKPTDDVVLVHDGGTASFVDMTFIHASDAAIRVLGASSSVSLATSVVRVADVPGVEHAALEVFTGGSADLTDTAIISPVQYGIIALGSGSSVTLTRSLVSGTEYRASSADGQNAGVALAISINEGAHATVRASTILSSQQYGIHASLGSTVTAEDVFVDATSRPESGEGGSAVIVDETGRVGALRCVIRGSADAAFVFRGGGSVVGESTIVGNALVLRIGGATLAQVSSPPAGEGEDVVFYSNHIHDNQTFSSKELPAAIVPPPFQTTP